jgi:Rrf2 family protein
MRISEGVEWAAHCATVLASLPDGAALSAGTLADFHGIPKPYLAKALQSLSRAGLVGSTAGRSGGYRLARTADTITMLDVVQAVDGDEPAFRCTEIRQRLPNPAPKRCFRTSCQVAASMWAAEAAWRDSLRSVTIAAIAADVATSIPERTLGANAAWLGDRAGRA